MFKNQALSYLKISPLVYTNKVVFRQAKKMSEGPKEKSGQGINSMKFTNAFKVTNFELFAQPNKGAMALGMTCFGLCLAYLAYMRYEFNSDEYLELSDDKKEDVLKKSE